MEPERKIEQWLKASAKKRRDDAGAPFELHPATRRLLQDEAARRTQKPAGGSSFLNLLALLRPRWVMVSCIVAVLVFGSWLILPRRQNLPVASGRLAKRELSGADRQNEPAIAPASPAPAGRELAKSDSVTLDDPTVALQSRREPQDGSLSGLIITNGTTSDLARLNGETVTTGPATVAANDTKLSDLAKKTPGQANGAIAGDRDSAASAPEPLSLGLGGSTQGRQVVRFKNDSGDHLVAAAAGERIVRFDSLAEKDKAVSTRTNAEVLTRFQVEQIGNEIRVVDGDGSVYSGYVASTDTEAGQRPAEFAGQSRLKAAADASAPAGRSAMPDVRQFPFHVAGTNRTLNQKVVFIGSVIATNGAATNGPPISVNNRSRISGKALIDDRREVEVNAGPAEP